MTELDLDTVVLFGLEPALDHADPASLNKLLARARSVISFNAFRSGVPDQARIALPIAPYTESSGTFLNCNGKMQFSRAAIQSQGNSRPGWKILRVLGNFLDLEGFDYVDISDVSIELPEPSQVCARTKPQAWRHPSPWQASALAKSLFRVGDIPIYRGDPVVRRATALARTEDGLRAGYCRLHPQEMVSRGLSDGGKARVFNEVVSVSIGVLSDTGIPPGSIYLAGALPEASDLTVSDRLSIEAIG
jgi:NADH-quinone oxidoreductase subunit G